MNRFREVNREHHHHRCQHQDHDHDQAFKLSTQGTVLIHHRAIESKADFGPSDGDDDCCLVAGAGDDDDDPGGRCSGCRVASGSIFGSIHDDDALSQVQGCRMSTF